jgi:transcriptional regulator with XRE-family HTH domain
MRPDDSATLNKLTLNTDWSIVGHVPRLARLRELRVKAALSQADLAERAGVARTTIIRLEAGDPNVLPSTLRKLSRALRVKPVDLMDGNWQS